MKILSLLLVVMLVLTSMVSVQGEPEALPAPAPQRYQYARSSFRAGEYTGGRLSTYRTRIGGNRKGKK
ncbi:hypothetical protein Pmani_009481 [Petrolisthes manimaculis]|uniref:Uncharacterized protein n=1 Tax=Petrolisthes manimaculis TaxID=1843537 RepID=A0AAE1Q436_9EUCA|nr:hypothetical protein Pmani_009481 [Petrolisthes manimaculis]